MGFWGHDVCDVYSFLVLIYVAENKLEVLSLHHWLDTEAALYSENFEKQGWDAPLPNVLEFNSYWSEAPTPDWLLSFTSPGFYEYLLGEEDKHFVVLKHPSAKGLMYIVFQDDKVFVFFTKQIFVKTGRSKREQPIRCRCFTPI